MKALHGIRLVEKARLNHLKWGDQDPQTLALCIAEESGEIAQAVLQHIHENGDEKRILEEAIDLGALCVQLMAEMERREAEIADNAAPGGCGGTVPERRK